MLSISPSKLSISNLVAGIESAPPVAVVGDGQTDGGFLIDLNVEDSSEDGGEENGEPDRKRIEIRWR